FDCIGASYGLTKSNVCRTVQWVENVLIKSGIFSLGGKKALVDPNTEIEVILVDSTEVAIERPKRGQKAYYSGKTNDIR
ncbi:MAG: IS5/IS1182 family transposase, partial [Clostridiales bacterium]|nr:IS5/IS1182 family transposase [Clostridiales bacterium]